MIVSIWSEPEPCQMTLADLKPYQQIVAREVAAGWSNLEICRRLQRCPQTIKNTLHDIYEVTGIVGRVRLARWVWEQEMAAMPPVRRTNQRGVQIRLTGQRVAPEPYPADDNWPDSAPGAEGTRRVRIR